MRRKQQEPAVRAERYPSRRAAMAVRWAEGENPSVDMFADPRCGIDRRRVLTVTEDSRRTGGERRRARPGTAWWLGRSYVEFHDLTPSSHWSRSTEHE